MNTFFHFECLFVMIICFWAAKLLLFFRSRKLFPLFSIFSVENGGVSEKCCIFVANNEEAYERIQNTDCSAPGGCRVRSTSGTAEEGGYYTEPEGGHSANPESGCRAGW
jgi:hypothetical protein